MYRYAPLYRPPNSATLPAGLAWAYVELPRVGHVNRPDLPMSSHLYGVISTERRLTAEECEIYELKAL